MFFELCVQNSYDLKTKFRCVIEINAEVAIAPDHMVIGKSIHFAKSPKIYFVSLQFGTLYC